MRHRQGAANHEVATRLLEILTCVEEAAEESGPDGAVDLGDGGGVAGAADVGGDEEARQLVLVALAAEEAEAVSERRGGGRGRRGCGGGRGGILRETEGGEVSETGGARGRGPRVWSWSVDANHGREGEWRRACAGEARRAPPLTAASERRGAGGGDWKRLKCSNL